MRIEVKIDPITHFPFVFFSNENIQISQVLDRDDQRFEVTQKSDRFGDVPDIAVDRHPDDRHTRCK